jgi:hypothetical protein
MKITRLGLRIGLAMAILFTIIAVAIPFYAAKIDRFTSRQDLAGQGDRLAPGSRASVRLIMADKGARDPFERTRVTVDLNDAGRYRRLLSGRANDAGTLDAGFLIPKVKNTYCSLVVTTCCPVGLRAPAPPLHLTVHGTPLADKLREERINRVRNAFFGSGKPADGVWIGIIFYVVSAMWMAVSAYQQDKRRALWVAASAVGALAALMITALLGTLTFSAANLSANWCAQGLLIPSWIAALVCCRREEPEP